MTLMKHNGKEIPQAMLQYIYASSDVINDAVNMSAGVKEYTKHMLINNYYMHWGGLSEEHASVFSEVMSLALENGITKG